MNKLLTTALLVLLAVAGCKKNKTFDPIVSSSEKKLPKISAIDPSIVTINSIVTITGENFGTNKTGMTVKFNGVEASIQSVTDKEIKVVIPYTGSGNVSLTLNDKTINGPEFTYITSSETAIAWEVSPSTVTAGTVATIVGNHFDPTGALKVWMNGVEAVVQSASTSEIKVLVPVTTSGNVVITSGGKTFQGPAFIYYGPVTVSQLSPSEAPPSTIVTITGSNFGTDRSRVNVYFNGVPAAIQTITDTEIKVMVPITTTGKVTVKIGDQEISGPVFTFISPLTSAYVGGSVLLSAQADVDAFVALNRGKQLEITGSLSINGADITSVSGLSNIVSVKNTLTIGVTPLLKDLSFLNAITTVGDGVRLSNISASTVRMDNLTGTTGVIEAIACRNLQHLSFKSLNKVTGNALRNGISISGSGDLTEIDFRSLREVTYGILISGSSMTDFSTFGALQSAGKLSIIGNSSLTSLKGLENLTSLTMVAVTGGVLGGSTVNGLYLSLNPKLTSVEGLKNLSNAPIARITLNESLNDLCPMKTLLMKLNATPDYTYRSTSLDQPHQTQKVSALVMNANGHYPTKDDALKGLEGCK